MPDVVELAAHLVRLPTVNPPGRERPATDLLAELLAGAGLTVTRVPAGDGRDTLVAVLRGSGAAPARIITGHVDVVGVSGAERERWTSPPFSGVVRGGRLHGRGAADMKGGVAALVTAALDLGEQGLVPPGDALLVLTVDEEDLMAGSKAVAGHPLLARGADVVVCEPTGLRLCTGGRGRTWARITVSGASGHGSLASGRNPIQAAARLIDALEAEDFSATAEPDSPASFWRPLAIHAGIEPCVVPDACTFTVDARLAPGHDPAEVWLRFDALVDRAAGDLPGLRVGRQVLDAREGWRTPSSAPVVVEASAALLDLGLDAAPSVFGGTTDGTVLRRPGAGHGVRDVVIVGPGDLADAHRENESVAISDLHAAVRLYRRLLLRG